LQGLATCKKDQGKALQAANAWLIYYSYLLINIILSIPFLQP
jgi:hypothetical protein